MEDVYKTPEADLIVNNSNSESGSFYVVSAKKFWVLFICTQGIYMTYWMYKNWEMIKTKQKLSCWPVARAIFMIFFFHDLYRRVDRVLDKNGEDAKWKTDNLATTSVVLMIIDRILDRIVSQTSSIGILDLISILMVFVMGGVLYKGQASINKASGDEFGESNSNFTPLNFLWIILGLSLWGVLVSTYMSYL